MTNDKRPVSYQQTLGTKTERIRKESEEQIKNNKGTNIEQADANFPE